MKKALLTILAVGITFVFFGCNQSRPLVEQPAKQAAAVKDESGVAKNTLVTFFDYLSQNEFAKAVTLFSADEADWETPNIYSSEEDKKNKAKVFENFCNATQTCLKVEVLSTTKKAEDDYVFTVQFREKDGSIMLYGPFNGIEYDTTPGETKFEYNVKKVAGTYKVITSPLYRP